MDDSTRPYAAPAAPRAEVQEPTQTDGSPRASVGEKFHRFAAFSAQLLGNQWSFAAAVLLIIGWGVTGPLFGFSDAWQLVINTGTTIITFMMVFLIQSTQNRDSRALHLKLDELIRSSRARNVFADLEEATDAELEAFQAEFQTLRQQGKDGGEAMHSAHQRLRERKHVRKGGKR